MVVQRPVAVTVFAVVNFILAAACILWLLFVAAVLVYGVMYSGDQGEELATGILGAVVLGVPGLVGVPVYMVAGLGLLRGQRFGYYFHLAGALLAAVTCLGALYTITAFVCAIQPEFSSVFSSSPTRPGEQRMWETSSWDEP